MINDIDMGRRVRIIKNSDRTDAEILAENYKKLIVEAKSEEEKDQFRTLRGIVINRLHALTEELS